MVSRGGLVDSSGSDASSRRTELEPGSFVSGPARVQVRRITVTKLHCESFETLKQIFLYPDNDGCNDVECRRMQ